MPDQRAPLGEFDRDGYVFAVRRDGEVHRVEAREGDSVPIPVCHIYNPFTPPNWLSGWFLDSWRPWIEQQAHQTIADAAVAESNRAPDVPAQPDHIDQ